MKKRSYASFSRGVCLFLAILMGVVLCATPAFAETFSVSGADHIYSEDNEGSQVAVLTVTGEKGATVYVNLKKGDEYIAKNLAFTLDDDTATVDANNDMIGTVSLDFNGQDFSNDETYSIQVYSKRYVSDENENEKNKCYAGTISTLRAWFGDVQKSIPLAVRTLSDREDREIAIPTTLAYNGVDYTLTSKDLQEVNGQQYYVYTPASNLAESIEGHVNYYDENHNLLRSDAVQLSKGASQEVSIPAVFSVDGDQTMYRTLTLADRVTLAYPGTTEFDVNCMQLSGDWGKAYYKASINYADTEGNPLGVVDTVIVNKQYLYTPPTYIYVTNNSGEVQTYKLADNNESLNSQGVLELQPDGNKEGTVSYDIVYEGVTDKDERTWTVVIQNGSVAPKDSNRIVERKTYKGEPGTTVSYDASESGDQHNITIDGTTYVPTAASERKFEHTFGVADMEVEQNVYYVPDGYVTPEAYDISVKYVNVANNQVISTETYTASPSMRSDLEISSPKEFTEGGVDWVRLSGQDEPIRHSFYDDAREYVVYYRDVNDDLHVNTVVRTVRVVYVDEEGNTVTRPTTVVDNGTTNNGTTVNETTTGGTAEGGTAEGGTAETTTATGGDVAGVTEATDTGLQTGANLLSVDGEDGTNLVTADGTDTGTVRIEDEETPLAGPNAQKGGNKGLSSTAAIAIGGAAAAVAAGLIFFFVYKRRKQGNGETSDDDLTA